MLALMAAATVVTAAIMMLVSHRITAAVFARPSPLATVVTGLSVLLAAAAGLIALAGAGVTSSATDRVVGMTSAAVVVVAYLLVMVPRAQRRDAQADARVGLWHAAAEDRPALRVALIRSYAMTSGHNGWAEVQIGAHPWRAWLNGRCRSGEIVLLECVPGAPLARIIDRLTPRETARYQQRHTRSDLTTAA